MKLRTASRLAAVAALAVFAVLTIAGRADAHLGHPLTRAERDLVLSLGDPPTLTYSVRLVRAEAARVRRAADVDSDGTVSTAEGNALVDRWGASLGADVTVASGRDGIGRATPIGADRVIDVTSSGVVSTELDAGELRVTWTFALNLDERADRLRIDDAFTPSPTIPFDSTEVRVRDSAARPLIGVGNDPSALAVSPLLSWVDTVHPGPRTLYVVWRPRPQTTIPIVPVLLATFVLVTLGLALWRRKK